MPAHLHHALITLALPGGAGVNIWYWEGWGKGGVKGGRGKEVVQGEIPERELPERRPPKAYAGECGTAWVGPSGGCVGLPL